METLNSRLREMVKTKLKLITATIADMQTSELDTHGANVKYLGFLSISYSASDLISEMKRLGNICVGGL